MPAGFGPVAGADGPGGGAAGMTSSSGSSGRRRRRDRVQVPRSLGDRQRGRVAGVGDDQRNASVGVLAQGDRQRDLPEQRHPQLRGELAAASFAENRIALARGGHEARHVLDHPADLQGDLVGHLSRPTGNLLGRRLGRRDDQEARLGEQLGERHRDVPSAGRQVDQEVVQTAPVDVLEELREGLVEHRTAPDDRGVLLEEEPDRHDLHAVGLQRQDLALGRYLGSGGPEAEHARDRIAPDVRVQDADALTLRGERSGQVGGQRRLAHAALTRPDAEHAARPARARPSAGCRVRACAAGRPSGRP